MTTRTRFAPSPTGYMHVGGMRTALFAWLIARQSNGKFILRIEDTDQKREVSGSVEHIYKCLEWLDLIPDEGPSNFGGKFGPYKQSERLDIYQKYAQKLIDAGRAYADPYTPEQLDAFREEAKAHKKPFLYRDYRPENPPAWDGSQPLRFRSEPKAYTWHDEVMGEMHAGPEVIDDFILVKSDGFPTYNFAHIVDDAEMEITHVIRGQEFLASTPKYLNLYDALDITWPIFASVPPIMNEQGNKKLSKRDGAKDILAYREEGYLPDAMLNFLASLGWNDGTEQEIFSKQELIDTFSLDRVQRSGARFDEKRLLWMNGQWIRRISLDELYQRVEDYWPQSAAQFDASYKHQVLALVQDRLKTLAELPMMSRFFFEEPEVNRELITSNKQLKKLSDGEIRELLKTAHDKLAELTDWTPETIQGTLNQLLEITGQKPGVLFSLIRIVTTWAPFSPQLNDTLALLGKDKTLSRIASQL